MLWSILTPRAIGAGLIVSAIIAGALWLRWDAVNDHTTRVELKRIETLRQVKERKNEIGKLSSDDLRNRLVDRVRRGR